MKCNILKDFLREFNQNENLRIKIIAPIFFNAHSQIKIIELDAHYVEIETFVPNGR